MEHARLHFQDDQLILEFLAETVFAWPGVGRLVVDAIDQRDIPTVTGALVMTTMLVTVVNLLIDIVYAFVDPRIKAKYSK